MATNIHLDHSSPLSKQLSPLCWFTPWDEETSTELGPWWATFPGEGVGLLWQPDVVGSFVVRCSWSMYPWSDQLWLVPCSFCLTFLVWFVLQCQMCLVMVESRVEGDPHWTLGPNQGKGEYWAQKHCPLPPWWWCMAHIWVGEACGGAQRGAFSANVPKLCHPPGTCVAPEADHAVACT